MIYLLIRKFHIVNSDMKPEYRVEKYSDNIDEANKFLSALTLLENIGLIVFGFVLFLVSIHFERQAEIKLFKLEQLDKAFRKAKENERL